MLNTVANLGHKWPNALMLWLLPRMTWEQCTPTEGEGATACKTTLDGYTVETAISIALGVLWLITLGPVVRRLKTLPRSEWLVSSATSKEL